MEIEDVIQTALLTPMGNPFDPNCTWGLPLLLWGSPGIGKSQRIKHASLKIGLPIEVTFPATRAPEDFSGVPVQKQEEIVIECILGSVRKLMKEGGNKAVGTLFLDEISCAPSAVQAALLGVVLDRKVGDVSLPPGIRVLSAANPPAEAAGGWDLDPPMANRFAHVNYPMPSKADWLHWLEGVESTQEAVNNRTRQQAVSTEERLLGEGTVRANWTAGWSKATGLMHGYMRKAGTLYSLPEPGNVDRGRAWPSPRTWEMATRAIATCFAIGHGMAEANHFVRLCVGEGQATAWAAWATDMDLPDPLVMCTRGWTPDVKRLDRTVVALSSMTQFVLDQGDKDQMEEYAIGAYNVMTSVDKAGQLDIASPFIKRLILKGLSPDSKNEKLVQACTPTIARMGKTRMSEYL